MELVRHSLDKCGTCERIPRSQIHLADFNPRSITAEQRKRLRKGLETHGLCTPLVWNKATGRIVGGHQRLGILDDLAPDKEWAVPVTVQELSEERERELNLLLNNQEAMGSYDLSKLGNLFVTHKLDIEATGFDAGKLKTLIPNIVVNIPDVAAKLAENKAHWQAEKKATAAKQEAAYDRIEQRAEQFTPQTESVEKPADRHEAAIYETDDLFYVVFVFPDLFTAAKCKQMIGLPEESRDQDGRILMQILQEKVKG